MMWIQKSSMTQINMKTNQVLIGRQYYRELRVPKRKFRQTVGLE